ncbi:ABC transporter ATP-binding protein [Nisaea acidiphila]|uniref:ABC transporter ATP-binding protein n=1 Tax=Nisaea acidiphila TaxID=1862145 RepID=A0A9J7AWV0_9PROT|nr:ABC transporter ATP-binding protein [Nisaea acidiphila]UUX51839.1 ABC transporter ATP-binding protein [Nisaea acidiphila]
MPTECQIRPVAPEFALEVRGLEKLYGRAGSPRRKHALKGVDLEVPRGSIFALLGPNGAGKSTLINILAGMVNKTAGTAKIWGIDIDEDPRQARAAIGIVPQELNIDAFFSPRELLDLQAGMYGVPKSERRTDEILELVDLADKADAYTRSLSGGMRRRLLVAKAMVHNPPILVLDEPTAGVDIELRRKLWENVRELNRRGVTILLTTHYLEEAEELCDRIAIINHGEVIACDTKENLMRRLDAKTVTVTVAEALPENTASLPHALASFSVEITGPQTLVFAFRKSDGPIARILGAIASAGYHIQDISTDESDLEDIFLELTSDKQEAGRIHAA